MKLLNEIKKGAVQAFTIISLVGITGITYATFSTINQVNPTDTLTSATFNKLITNQEDLKTRLDNLDSGKVINIKTINSTQNLDFGGVNIFQEIPNLTSTITPITIGNKVIIDYNLGSWSQDSGGTSAGVGYGIKINGTEISLGSYIGWNNINENYKARNIITGKYIYTVTDLSQLTITPILRGEVASGLLRSHNTPYMVMTLSEIN